MRTSVAYSCILHAAVIALAYFGLPELRRNLDMVETPITVDIVTVADETNAPSPPPEVKKKPKPEQKAEAKPEPPPPAPPVPEPKPEPKPKPAPPPQPEPKPEAVAPLPPPEPKPEAKAKPKPEPKPEVKPEPPKPAPPKPEPPAALAQVKPRHKPKPPDAFASVLKTVAELKKQPPPKAEEKPDKKPDKKPAPQQSFEEQIAKALKTPARPYNPQRPLTISEIDLVRQQIAQCWNLPAGAKDAKDLVIEIQTVMNPTGTVREARIVDQARLRTDPFFRAAAESALRAVLNPRCSPLRLPPDKYDQWKDMVLNFNPKDMF